MKVQLTLALYDGRPVVLEQRPDLPLIVHTFDSAKDALAFYEQFREEPLSPEARRMVLRIDPRPEVCQ